MPRRPAVALPTFNWKTTCFSAVMLLIELLSTLITFILYHFAPVQSNIILAAAFVHLASVAAGILGFSRSTPPVIVSLIVSVGACATFAVIGGICLVFASDAKTSVANLLDDSLELVGTDERAKLVRDAKGTLFCAAAILLIGSALHLLFGWHLYKIVGEKRGSVAILQAFSLITFPFSLFLITGGQYVADTGTLVSAPYTGIVIFSSGVVFMLISMLAFVGANFEYRRLLSICYLLSIFVGTSFLGLTIAYFAMKRSVQENIVRNWEDIRLILPPTSRGVYDRDQFASTMRSYLKVVACVGSGAGLFLLVEASACMTLLHHTTIGKRQFAVDKHKMSSARGDGNSINNETDKRHQWVERFAASKRRQRIAMRLITVIVVLVVAFIFAVMCTSVVFASKCNRVGSLLGSSAVSLVDSATATGVAGYDLETSFSRGYLSIYPSSTMNGTGSLQLFGTGNTQVTDDIWDVEIVDSIVDVSVLSTDSTRVLWLDKSCQRIAIDIELPQDRPRTLTVRSNTSVNINTPASPSAMTLRSLDVSTDKSPISLSNVSFEEGGLVATSNAGAIFVDSVNVDTMGTVRLEKSSSIASTFGLISVRNVTLLDCDLHVATGAGTIQLTNIDSTVTAGRSFVRAESSSGVIASDGLRANWIELATIQGNVVVDSLVSEGSSSFMGRLEVTTVSGDITLQQIDASGNVHIESASGNVKLQLASLSYVGMYYLRSEDGVVSIRLGEYSGDILQETENSTSEHHGSINCDIASGSCLSFGDLHVHTTLGDIEIIVGCDSFQCT